MKFDWDQNKAKKNFELHNVSFDEASKVFEDNWAIDFFDDFHSDFDEQRFTIIGLAGIRLLFVSYTVRSEETDDEIFRIISAREAEGHEIRDYEQNRNRHDFRG